MALWRERTQRDNSILREHQRRVDTVQLKRKTALTALEVASIHRDVSASIERDCACSLQQSRGGSHHTTVDNQARCRAPGGCGRSFCHYHSLELRRSHASDDILDSPDHVRYHAKHIKSNDPKRPSRKDEFNNSFGQGYPSRVQMPELFPDASTKAGFRLVWFALTFRRCRPERHGRLVLGWYDRTV